MAAVMIGVDPHKASHTAAAIGPAEEPLGEVQVRASAAQAGQLLAWAAGWPERTWAAGGAAGLGSLLAQQLVAAGEVVLDVQPKVAARVRLLASGNTNKNDPNDARSVAVAALRSPARRRVAAEDHTAVLKVWSKRYRDLGRARTQVACRLHAVLADLVPGGFSREITAGQAASMLKRIRPSGPAARARRELAADFIADLRRLDAQIRQTRNKLAATVQASGTTLTGIFGVGPVIAAAVLGTAGDPSRFGDRDRFAAYNGTAPVEVSSGDRKIHRLSLRGNRRLNHAIHMAAVTQIRYTHSPGRAYFDRKIAEGKTGKEALRCLKRQISDAIYARLQADARAAAAAAPGGSPGGQSGNGSDSSAAGSHPRRRLFGQATPGPAPTLRPPASCRASAEAHATTPAGSPAGPARDDNVTAPAARCPVCAAPFTPVRRQRYCSPACKQKAFRARQPAPVPASPPHGPARRQAAIYQCGECDQRYLADQWCHDCNRPCQLLGHGGLCPCCEEPITTGELLSQHQQLGGKTPT